MPESPKRSRFEITVSWTTLLKVFIACLLAYLAVRLWRLAELLLLALLIAIAFWPLIQWTKKRRWPKWTGLLLSALLLLGSTGLFVVFLVPTIGTEGKAFIEKLPASRDQLLSRLSPSGPIRDFANQLLSSPALSNPEPILKYLAAWGGTVLESLVGCFVVLIVAIYFLADGERVYKWLLAFLPEIQRQKIAVAGEEIASVVGHYMIGQVITSVLCAAYAFGVLIVFRVPNAALLAVLAGIFDFLPLIGFFLFAIPAVAMAFTVSPATAGIVAALYVAYHLVENYFIVPKVYGNRLKISTLTVLVACLAAGLVAGVVGVILVLPMVASYPILERIWLQPYLESGTVQKHARLIAKEHPDK
jgi:predicted PurR-regulated permease PerM